MREVDYVEDVGQLASTQNPHGPAVVFQQLSFSHAVKSYLDHLQMNQWWGREGALKRMGVYVHPTRCQYSMYTEVFGWHKDADKSLQARERLRETCRLFFPLTADGHDDLAWELSKPVARFAAATNQRSLLVVMTAALGGRRPPQKQDFMLRDKNIVTGEMALRGPARLFANRDAYTPDMLERARDCALTADDDAVLRAATEQPKGTVLSMWSGLAGSKRVLTAPANLEYEEFQLSVTLEPALTKTGPAYDRNGPTVMQAAEDRLRTGVMNVTQLGAT
jgi:hypothetical protein